MSAKHRDPEYIRNAKTWRKRVHSIHRSGEPVQCWRCRRAIVPGQPFDIGHIDGAIGHSMAELAPEHRHATPYCTGNRAHGGQLGAAKTNAARQVPQGQVTTWKL